MTRQGTPTATTLAGMSCVTTLPAPMTALSPMVTPASTVQPAPSQTRLPTVMGRAISSPSTRSSGSMGCSAVVKQQLGPTNTLSPKRTSAPSVMMRSWFE